MSGANDAASVESAEWNGKRFGSSEEEKPPGRTKRRYKECYPVWSYVPQTVRKASLISPRSPLLWRHRS